MTCHFRSGSRGSRLSGSQLQQQRHANSFAHGTLQPYAHPSHKCTPQQAHQTPPFPYEGTPEPQLLKKSTAHSNIAPRDCLQQPSASAPAPLSHHHHPCPPHATPTSHSHHSASFHHHTAIVQKHFMQQEWHQSPASYTHPWSDPSKPRHSQPNPNKPSPATHTHRLSDPTKLPPATGPYPGSDPGKPIPADIGLMTVQQHHHPPLQDATNQQLSLEAAPLSPNDPLGPMGPSNPAPAAPQDPLRAAPVRLQDPLAQSRVAPWPHWDPWAPSKPTPLGPNDPLGPSTATPSPLQNPLAPSTAGPSAVLRQPPAAAVAAASHCRVVLDSTVAGSPVTSTHTHCIGAWPTSSQAHNAAPGSQEARSGTSQVEEMTELKKAPGLQLMLYQWGLPRQVVQVRPVCSQVTHSRRHVLTQEPNVRKKGDGQSHVASKTERMHRNAWPGTHVHIH